MSTSYGMSRRIWKWTKKFFHITDLVIVNALIIHRSCGGIMTYRKWREKLIRDLILLAYDQNVTVNEIALRRPSAAAAKLISLKAKHSVHWPAEENMRHCRVCTSEKKVKIIQYFCRKCDCSL
jgi:hypothetical protein